MYIYVKCSNFLLRLPFTVKPLHFVQSSNKKELYFCAKEHGVCVCVKYFIYWVYQKELFLISSFLFFLTWRNIMGTYTMISLPLPYSLAVFNEVGLKLENEIYYYYYSVLLLLLLSCHYTVLFFSLLNSRI